MAGFCRDCCKLLAMQQNHIGQERNIENRNPNVLCSCRVAAMFK
jgi:hypothetical protein